MFSYLISYDLIHNKNYDEIHKIIRSFEFWAKITESFWCIKSDKSCTEIRDILLHSMDNDDRLFVAKSSGEAAWKNNWYINCY